ALERAMALVRSHAERLATTSDGSRRRELPNAIELWRVGDTLAFLSGTSRLRGTLVALMLPAEALRQRAVDALLAASAATGEESPAAFFAASDAWLALLEAGQAHLLFR
nr:hypothetical protein [Polyangiaceae bacterium]